MGVIGNIRKHSWIAVLIVGIAIVAFIIGDLSKNNRGQETFGKVNGNEITYNYFNQRLTQREQMLKMYGYSNYSIKEAVWQDILQERLLGKEIATLGIMVGEKEMSDMFLGRFIPQSLQQQLSNPQTGMYDKEYVRAVINQFPQLPDTMEFKQQWLDLERAVREEREQNKYFAMIYGGLYMPKALAEKVAEIDADKYDVRVAGLLYSQAQTEPVNLTEEDYLRYFNAHKKEINAQFFRGDLREQREAVYAVFTSQPSQSDLEEINAEVNEWWNEIQQLDGVDLTDYINMHGFYDSTYVNADIFSAPLDSIVRNSRPGTLIEPVVVRSLTKEGVNQYTYGEYALGKVLATQMRPDSIRVSMVFIPSSEYAEGITTTPDEAKHLCDSAFALINAGMPFEEAVRQFSVDTTNQGDQDWLLDGAGFMFNEEAVRANVGSSFVYDLPADRGYLIVKVTDKTQPKLKYRVALATKPIQPSSATERGVRDAANLFASQFTTVEKMTEGAQAQNIPLRNCFLIMMSDSLTGYDNTREAVRWAFDEKTAVGAVSGEVYQSDYNYIVVGLRDIYVPNNLKLDQVRQSIEPMVRIEKLGAQLAETYANAGNDVDAAAAKMGVTVDSLTAVSFRGYFGRYGMEPKVVAAIAAKKSGFVGPLQGASGIYFVNIDGSNREDELATDMICYDFEQRSQSDVRGLMTMLQSRAKIVDNRIKFF